LTDDERWGALAPAMAFYPFEFNNGCAKQRPDIPSITMGVTPGWLDFYSLDLDFQWIDVSDVAPGDYLVRTVPDPLDLVAEGSETNNVNPELDARVTIPGYVARPTEKSVRALLASEVELPFDTVHTELPGRYLGEPLFEITAAPRHGRLSRAVGECFTGGSVTYTPDAGFVGTDSFRFAIRDRIAPDFPREPVEAVATIRTHLVEAAAR
jgi:hypothetical protein